MVVSTLGKQGKIKDLHTPRSVLSNPGSDILLFLSIPLSFYLSSRFMFRVEIQGIQLFSESTRKIGQDTKKLYS